MRRLPAITRSHADRGCAAHTPALRSARRDRRQQSAVRARKYRESAVAGGFGRPPWPSNVSFRRARFGRAGFRLGVRACFRPGSGRPRVGPRARGPWSALPLFRTPAGAGCTLAPLLLPIGLSVQRPVRLTVSRSKRDLDLDDFIPLLVSAIALGDAEKFAEPTPRIQRGRFIHAAIMTHTAAVVQQA